MNIDKRSSEKSKTVYSYNQLSFLRLRRIWWRLRYYRATCRVEAAGASCVFEFGNPTSRRHLKTHYGESDVFHEFLRELQKGDVVWDVGASVGLYSVFAAQVVGSSGVVCAFEPMKIRLRKLKRNARLNKADNLRLFQTALSNYTGSGRIDGEQVAKSPGGSINLEIGDNLVATGKAPKPNVLKIDVEGAEWHVLDGMRDVLSDRSCRFITIEIHPRLLVERKPEEIEEIFSDYGFSIGTRIERGSEQHWVARKM